MRYAVCTTDPAVVADAREAGFDYIEVSVPAFVRPGEPDAAFEGAVAAFREGGMPAESANLFLQGDLRCTGPAANHDRIVDYAADVFERLGKAGVAVLVFGSGWARAVPDGWPKEKADAQFADLLSRLAPLAAGSGVALAVEPLARVECNFLNTVAEGAAFARGAASPAVGVLADSFHWARNGETADSILAARGVLAHAHLATHPGRLAPGLEPYDFEPFFRALLGAGYDGRVSIEARLPPPEGRAEAFRRALDILKAAERAARGPARP